jgi:hypothetical protein
VRSDAKFIVQLAANVTVKLYANLLAEQTLVKLLALADVKHRHNMMAEQLVKLRARLHARRCAEIIAW